MFSTNEITVTNRYGWAILTDNVTGKAMVCEPTMAGPDIIAFHIVERCEDYQTAFLLTFTLNEMGVHPTDYTEESNDAADPAAAVPVPPALAAAAAAGPEQG